MPGKKWCEYCRINLPYSKKAIQDHEQTRTHIHNKQKHIKYERIKIIRQEKADRQAVKANADLASIVPRARKGSELQKQVNEYQNDVMASGKMAIHQLIAQRTQGLYGAPIQYPEKEDLVIAENYQEKTEKAQDGQSSGSEEEQQYSMWKIDICEENGKPCFINKVTKAVFYEPPTGHVLSQDENEQWEELLQICQQIPEQNSQDKGEIGLWEQVPDEENYYQQHKVQSDLQEDELEPNKRPIPQIKAMPWSPDASKELKLQQKIGKQDQQPQNSVQKSWIQKLQSQVNNNEVTQEEVFEAMLKNTLNECHNMKQANETLKKLVKNDIQMHASMMNLAQKQLLAEEQKEKKIVGLKPRKKVKNCQLLDEKDFI